MELMQIKENGKIKEYQSNNSNTASNVSKEKERERERGREREECYEGEACKYILNILQCW